MGHTYWTMIARVYGQWMPAADEKAGSKAEELWGKVNGRHRFKTDAERA